MAGLSDAEVFGAAPAAPSGGGLSDAEVFGQSAPGVRPTAQSRYHAASRGIATAQPREAPSTNWEDVGNVARRVLPAANNALAETAGRALDVVPYFAGRAIGMSEAHAPHPVENLIKNYTVPDVGAPKTAAQGMASAGGKMMGETAPYAVGGAGLFTRMAKPAIDAAPTVADAFRRAFSSAGDAMAARPAAAIGGEAAGALESGAVGEALRASAEREGESPAMQQFKESAGQVLGPTALQMAPIALASKIAKPIANRVGPVVDRGVSAVADAIPESIRPAWAEGFAQRGAEKQKQAATAEVGEKLRGALSTPEAQAGLTEAERLQEKIPGFKPGVARATNDPELVNTQQSRDTSSAGEDLRARQGAYDESKGAIANKLETMIPQAERPRPSPDAVGPQPKSDNAPQDAVNIAGRRVDTVNSKIAAAKESTQGELTAQADALPVVDRIDAGNNLRASRDAAQRATDAETTRLRGAIANPETPLQVGDQQTTVGAALERRTTLNQEGRDITNATARSPADNARLRAIAEERDQLDSAIEGVSDKVGGLREYANHYKNENVPNFRQGASAEVGRRDSFGYGGDKVDPEQVGKKFFNPNEESAGAQFDRSMGHDPAARKQMVDNALDDFRHSGIDLNTNSIKKGEVEKWLKKNERVLNALGDTGTEIRSAINANNPDALYGRLGQIEQLSRTVKKEKLSKVLKSIAGPGQNPENAIHAALNDPALMRQLVRSAGEDPSAQHAVRRAVFEQMRKDAPDVLTEPDKFLGWMKGNRRSLSQAFTPEHLADLEAVARAAKMQGNVGRPQGTVAVPKSIVESISQSIGITPSSAASTARGVAQGRTSLAIEGVAQGGKFLNRQASRASNAAWDEALANPEAARMVAAMVRGKPTAAQSAKLHSYLISAGVDAAEPDRETASP